MSWKTELERNNDMDSGISESMEKYDDSFFDDFFEDNKDQRLDSNVTEDDLSGLIFDDTSGENSDSMEMPKEADSGDNSEDHPFAYKYDPTHSLEIGTTYQDDTEGAKVLKLTKGDMSGIHKDMGNDQEGIKAMNEFYSDIAGELYENMKNIHEDDSLSNIEKIERLAQETRKWEICKQEWAKDINGKK